MKKRNNRGICLALALLLAVTVFASITTFQPNAYRTSFKGETTSAQPDIPSRSPRSP